MFLKVWVNWNYMVFVLTGICALKDLCLSSRSLRNWVLKFINMDLSFNRNYFVGTFCFENIIVWLLAYGPENIFFGDLVDDISLRMNLTGISYFLLFYLLFKKYFWKFQKMVLMLIVYNFKSYLMSLDILTRAAWSRWPELFALTFQPLQQACSQK